MTGQVPRLPFLATWLAVALLLTAGLPAGPFSAHALETAPRPVNLPSTGSLDGPAAHFGFGQTSVLEQATATSTTQTNAIASLTAAATPSQTGTANTPCQSCSGTFPTGGSFTYTKTAAGTLTINNVIVPANVLAIAPTVFAPTTLRVEALTCPNGPGAAGTAYSCTVTTTGDLLLGAVVTVRFVTTTGPIDLASTPATGTTAGGCTTTATCITAYQTTSGIQFGTAGAPCGDRIGQSCTVAGSVTGTGVIVSSMTWNLTATAPAPAAVVASTPFVVFNTTAGFEAFPCAFIAAATAVVTCNVTTIGNALQGSSVAVFFPGVAAPVLGTVTGPGGGNSTIVLPNLPLLPPPPLEFIPPPPPPGSAVLGTLPDGQGVPCADVMGATCTVGGGAITGRLSVTGSMAVAISIQPDAILPGSLATVFFFTDRAAEFVTCPAAVAGVATACGGTLVGNAIQRSTVRAFVGSVLVASGLVTGPGPSRLPRPPAPPPPPPPPMLPIVAPPTDQRPIVINIYAPGAAPEVPVVPEADSMVLLLGGIGMVGGVALLRSWRRRKQGLPRE